MVKGYDVSRYLDKFDTNSDGQRGHFKPYDSYYLPADSFAAPPATAPQARATPPKS